MAEKLSEKIYNSIKKDIEDGKVRSSEQVAREEEAFEQRFKDKEESEDPEDDN